MGQRLLPSRHPWVQCIFHELQGLLLYIRKAGFLEIPHHVRRHTENTGDLINLELSGFQKLCFVRRNGHGLESHALFQNGDAMAVLSRKLRAPAFTQTFRIFHDAWVL